MSGNGTDRNGAELRRLLTPVAVETFLHEYWGQRPLHIPGNSDKFNGLFDREHLGRALTQSAKVLVHASHDYGRTLLPIKPSEVDSMYEGGATICVTHVQEGSASLNAYCRQLERQLSYPGIIDLRAYLSPHDSGFAMHYDARVTTTLQIEGRKRWRFSTRPAVSWPTFNNPVAETREDLLSSCSFEEVTLAPGDVLCLPAGTWHGARAEGYSLALNVAVIPVDFFGLVSEQLQASLRNDAFWREPVPPAGPVERASGGAPDHVRRYLASRFEELSGLFRRLGADPTAVDEFWYSGLVRTRHDVTTPPSAANANVVSPDDVVMLKEDVDAYRIVRDGEKATVVVYYGPPPRKLSLPIACRDLVEELLSGRALRARAACARLGDMPWTGTEQLLRRLIVSGFIQLSSRQATDAATG